MLLLIYVPVLSNRIKYILGFVFTRILDCKIEITDNTEHFSSYTGPKLSYADYVLADELFFKQSGFLSQKGHSMISPGIVRYHNYSVCFPVEGSAMPFDVFAAAFFLVSRYEEYHPDKTDQHGRFRGEDSFAFKAGFLRQPVIDEWAYEILKIIQNRFPGFKPPGRKYSYIPTIDIDRAYAWKYSDFVSTIARLAKNILLFRFAKTSTHFRVIAGKEKDPFDTYDLMQRIHKTHKPIFFFLMGDCSRYDNSISCELPQFRQLIIDIAGYADVGLHPSYRSNTEPARIAVEKSRLEEITGSKVVRSRQHFLKMEKPLTYQRLLKEGIKEDHSMGYASQVGFRAGTCTPFNWYDLSHETETDLAVYPFAAMEVTLSKYMRLKPGAAVHALKSLCDNVRNVNGTFITLWHNESLTDKGNWQGWLTVYEQIVKYASTGSEQ